MKRFVSGKGFVELSFLAGSLERLIWEIDAQEKSLP